MAPLDLLKPQSSQSLTQEKLSNLRALMATHRLDGYLIPSADEHLNEYLPHAKQRRTWISSFTGSAGDLLVGQDQSWLFVDSRYHEQADFQVDLSLIQVSKLGLEGHKSLSETLEALGQEATQNATTFRLGFDPFTLAVESFRALQKRVEAAGVVLVTVATNLIDQVRIQSPWIESEPLPLYANSKLFRLPDSATGATVEQKLTRVREAMQTAKTDILPLTKLDQIAWLFNLRGWDVPYNPVFIAYAIITPDQAFLFTNLDRIEVSIQQALTSQVTLLPYEQYAETLKSLISPPQSRVLLDPKHTTMGTYWLLVEDTPTTAKDNLQVVEAANPIEGIKACKNAVEVEQMQQANLRASRAKVRTLKWLSDQLTVGQQVTEADVAAAIAQYYSEEADFQGLSFDVIAATGANSSIVHYGTPNAKTVLKPGELLLLDSGAQYLTGTTDDTRTLIIGEPTPEQIERYTEVLKAHINCAMQRFPKGTTGQQLDGITRSTLWLSGLDYGHGTGHGVGAFLNVHEGPNGISKRSQAPLEPGMVTSIEPGFYQPGWGGIRIENLYVVKDLTPSSSSQTDAAATAWYGFEPLTYIPFEKRLIDLTRLELRQQQWLESYHAAVLTQLASTLSTSDAEWLHSVCSL
jgi:Xaa-Pro aminopeptidase